jgi:LPS export ABC transporter protein LptC
MKLQNKISKAAIVLIAAFFMACGNEQAEIDQQSELNEKRDSLSVEIARDVTITYTDSAILRAKISAPMMKRFPDKDNPRLEMPEGVHADFYDGEVEVQSSLTANYAMHFEKEDRIEIRDSVRVINKNDEEIKTDELIWDKKKRRVTSDKPVRVRIRNEKIIKAQGFESDESFMNYTFKKVTGVVYLNDDVATPEE